MLVKNLRGFTLIELLIVVVIVGILATVSVPVYHTYTQRARASEGKALVGAVASAEKIWFMQHKAYRVVLSTEGGHKKDPLGINASQNAFFRTYTVDLVPAGGFTVITNGLDQAEGIAITFVQPKKSAPTLLEVFPE